MKTKRSITMTLLALGLLAAPDGAQGQQPGSSATRPTPVLRQGSSPVASPLSGATMSTAGSGQYSRTLTPSEMAAAMTSAGFPATVFGRTFRLSAATPVVEGRGWLSATHVAQVIPGGPGDATPVIVVYDRMSSDGGSHVSLTIATEAGRRYLIHCSTVKRGVTVSEGDTPGVTFSGSDPVQFVLEATGTGVTTIRLAGDGPPGIGNWLFYACDITPAGR